MHREACLRLKERIRADAGARVESLLADEPELAGDDDALLELILAETAARRARGDDSTAAEWATRLRALVPDPRRREALEGLLSTEMKTLAEPSSAAAQKPRAVRGWIGRYHVLEEIGRGGMGVVYKARQVNPGRLVALKMILAGEHANARERAYLRKEAETAAKITHPNIVQILDADEHEGLPFLVMEYVDGGPLARMTRSAPQPIRWSTRLIETLARAIHVAHRAGIVHRDLNPTNILMTQDGVPKIGDFGLAKFLLADDAGSQSGKILGTPSYMAPEQLSQGGREVDARTDVYALGAVLYEMLAGTPPFRGLTPMETLCQVAEGEVVAPSRLRHGLPEDLETICLKCLERNPAARYPDARALADDLRRFQAREPIHARRTPRLRRAAQWAGREPLAAGLLALSLLLLATLIAVAGYYSIHLRNLATQAEQLYGQLQTQDYMNRTYKGVMGSESELAQRSRHDFQLGRIHSHAARGEIELAIEMFDSLKRASPREDAFEWRYIDRLIHRWARLLSDASAHRAAVSGIAASRDGRWLLSGDVEGRVVAWDVDGGGFRPLVDHRDRPARAMAVASGPDGGPIAYASVHVDEEAATVRIWAEDDASEHSALGAAIRDVAEIGFVGGDDLLIARCRGGDSSRWRALSYRKIDGGWRESPGDEIRDAFCLAFSPDGATAAIGVGDGSVVVRGPGDRRSVLTPPDPARPTALAFSADGRALATGWDDGRIVAWDLDAEAPSAVLTCDAGPPSFLAFGPRGRSILVIEGGRAPRLRESRPGGRVHALSAPNEPPSRFSVAPDGGTLVLGYENRPTLVWDLTRPSATPDEIGGLLAPSCLEFSPAGDALFLSFDQPAIFVHSTKPAPSPRIILAGHSEEAWALAFSPDGAILASGGDDHQIKLWDVATSEELAAVEAHSQTVTGLAFAPQGGHLASVSLDGSWKIWRVDRTPDGRGASLSPLHELRPPGAGSLRCVAYSADGLRVAASGTTPDILMNRAPIYDSPSVIPGAHSKMITALAFARGPEPFLATASIDRLYRVWDAETGSPVSVALHGDSPLLALAFSPPGRGGSLLAAGGDPRLVSILDTRDFTMGPPVREHPASIRALAFSTRGETLATGCDDGRLRLCDAATRQVVYALDGHRDRINAVAFSPDDSTLASCSHSGQVILWKAGPPPPP
ncbi:protein kinase [Paludisphaera sp.]|uniref:WD40 repeat domain-containing serine/threonine protein kinase n=1 Tax=Paludisphaera sp. TaxID=2017432 RepID=UPI00301C48B3